MPKRTFQDRMDAIPGAIERGKAFRARVAAAAGDVLKCADLMAEAIEMHREQRSLEVVGRDGRNVLCMEELEAMYCIDAARDQYLKARGSSSYLGAAQREAPHPGPTDSPQTRRE